MRKTIGMGCACVLAVTSLAQEVSRRRDVDFASLKVTQREVEAVKGEAPSLLPQGDWKLVWNDEFNGTELDRTKWLYRTNFYGRRMKGYTDKGAELLEQINDLRELLNAYRWGEIKESGRN